MKEGWKLVKLEDVCKFSSGFAFKSNKFTEEGEPIIRISDIQNDKVDDTGVVFFDPKDYDQDLSKYIIYPNDILIAMSGGTTGKIGINKTGKKFYLNQRVGVFREDKAVLDHTFLFHYLHTKSEEGLRIAAGAAQPNLSSAQIKNYIIPLPPLSEQQSIVAHLDASFAEIDALKAKAAEEVANAKAMFDAALREEMTPKEGWEEKTFTQVCEIQSGYAFKSSSFKSEGQYQIIRMGNVRPGMLRLDENPVFGDFDDDKVISKAKLNIGDIIITQTGTRHKRDYGFTAIIDTNNLMLNQRLARLRVNSSTSNSFVLYYTWTDLFRDQFFASEGGAVGQGNVGIDAIKNSIIPLPSLSVQQRIVAKLDTLRSHLTELEQKYNLIAANCDALKQAILRETFE